MKSQSSCCPELWHLRALLGQDNPLSGRSTGALSDLMAQQLVIQDRIPDSSQDGSHSLFFFFFNLFIYGCVGSSFLCEGFLHLRQAEATLHRGARASHHFGPSCCGAQAPDAQAQ